MERHSRARPPPVGRHAMMRRGGCRAPKQGARFSASPLHVLMSDEDGHAIHSGAVDTTRAQLAPVVAKQPASMTRAPQRIATSHAPEHSAASAARGLLSSRAARQRCLAPTGRRPIDAAGRRDFAADVIRLAVAARRGAEPRAPGHDDGRAPPPRSADARRISTARRFRRARKRDIDIISGAQYASSHCYDGDIAAAGR